MRQGEGAVRGTVDPVVADDFPELALWSLWCAVPARGARGRARLDELDDRARGVATGSLRTDSVAGAYRGFARQIGLDPDVERNPLDQAAMQRLVDGRLRSRGVLDDALLVAMLETGVPLWALDGDAVHGLLRVNADPHGALHIADERRALAPLLGAPAPGAAPRRDGGRAVVYALRVAGVPATTVEEAFWHVREETGA